MCSTIERIAELEWANYAAILATAQVTPGLDLIMRDDVIITSSAASPIPDLNHACLLRATAETLDSLIAEIIQHFTSRGLPAAIYVSPACTPGDLPSRLLERGFVQQEEEEAWLAFDGLLSFELPPLPSKASIRRITPDEIPVFAEVFVRAFGMPADLAPYMAQVMQPSAGLPGIYHYLATVDGRPVGTCSLACYERFGILGSAGVLPAFRKRGAATGLVIRAMTEAQQQGVDTVILQTTADRPLERLLRISGFSRAFTRSCYVLT